MNKCVLISIRPKWCELIANGDKTIEVRKTRPNLKTPFKCYIYCTSVKRLSLSEYVETHRATGGAVDDWHGKVIGEFTCDRIDWITHVGYMGVPDKVDTCICDAVTMRTSPIGGLFNAACLTPKILDDYLAGRDGYGWHITNLCIYDTPRDLSEFTGLRVMKNSFELRVIDRPPQSWTYVQECNHA